MTIRVSVKNEDATRTVRLIYRDTVGPYKAMDGQRPRLTSESDAGTLKPGESKEWVYVHATRELVVREEE